MPMDKKDEIGAFWERTSKKGTNFLAGKINGKDVIAFREKEKKNPKSPDWRIYLSTPREEKKNDANDTPWGD
jgi:uncharacterized protein (DUF736 family)